MFDNSFSNEITDYRKLRTGHKRLKVVVADQKRRILFIAKVWQNRCRSSGTICFDNSKTFFVSSRTVEGQKVSVFLWTEELERRWIWQSLIDKIAAWLENATPAEVIVVSGFVGNESGRGMVLNHIDVHLSAKWEIVERLSELGIVPLQRIADVLYVGSGGIAA